MDKEINTNFKERYKDSHSESNIFLPKTELNQNAGILNTSTGVIARVNLFLFLFFYGKYLYFLIA
jgi:hypothetical protein